MFNFVLICFQISPSWAGELRPFVLPSTNKSIQTEQASGEAQTSQETPSVYQKFEEDVRKMNVDERKKIQEYYKKQQLEAEEKNDRARMDYYNTLLGILNKYH